MKKYLMFDDDPEAQAAWDALPGYETVEGCEIRVKFFFDYLAKRYGKKHARKVFMQTMADFKVPTSNSRH